MSDTALPTVAVLGTGIMGAAMARNLLATGHPVRVWNRTAAKAQELASDGAVVTESPADAVSGADVILTMLYDGPAVLDAIGEAAPGLQQGATWVQSTTVGLESAPPIAEFATEHGIDLIEAPVLGTRQPAENGQLVMLAAGAPDIRDRVSSVFDAVGSRTIWLGDDPSLGAATRLKLVANSWVLAVTSAAGEVVALAKGLGVDPQNFFDAIGGGALDMPYLRMKAGAILDDSFTPPSFAVKTAAKDAHLIAEAGRSNGVRLDGAEAAAARFDRAAAAGHADDDMAAAYFASFS